LRFFLSTAALWLSVTLAGCSAADAPTLPSLSVSAHAVPAEAEGYGDYLSAHFAADNYDLTDAAKFYRESYEADPSDQELLTFAFFYAASAGDVDSAATLAEKLVATAPDDRAARLTLAVEALKREDYKTARSEIGKSAKGPFTSFTVTLVDGWAAAGLGDGSTAASDLASLHAVQGADALATFNEAMLAEFLGQNELADTLYRKELDAAGPSARVIDAYGRFLERHGRANDAAALYKKAPNEPAYGPVVEAGLKRIAAGEKPAALVTHAEDGAAEALYGIAASLNDDNDREVSILYLRLALFLEPRLDLADLVLGDKLEALAKYDDAIAVFRSVDKNSSYARLAAIEIAIDEMRLKQTDQAIADLKALCAAYPDYVDAWTSLGDAYNGTKDYASAEKAYSSAITASGEGKADWTLYFARAVVEQSADNWDVAETDLQTALKLSPNQPQVLNYLGYTWVDQHRNIGEALAMLEKARALAPQDGYIIDSVGWAYYRLGRYGDAAKTLEDAVLLVPGDPTINDHLGDAYWMEGKKLDARFQWSHALAFGAEDGEKTKIEMKLQVGLNPDDKS
jgi:tetratricopeptide (TPR) repeat protein